MRFHPVERLSSRLAAPDDEVVFVVGSALTMPAQGVPGVPGVWAVTEAVVAEVKRRLGPVEAAGLKRDIEQAGGRAYQVAFDHLTASCGPEAANRVIRDAVLTTHRHPPTDRSPTALAALEHDPAGWHLPPAVKALGWVLAHGGPQFRAPVLTTNFDPLIEVAIRAAGGQAVGFSQLDDAAVPAAWGSARHVIHVHGHWLDDTWHTEDALRLDRPRLQRSLARLFDGRRVVVLGYGGWQDALMASLAEVVRDVGAKPQVLWGFYGKGSDDAAAVAALRGLGPRATFYEEVDVHRDLPRLRARLNKEHAQIGRTRLCDGLLGALDGTDPVEIVGERFMKRSRLLEWLEAQARALGRRVVRVHAGRLAQKTPAALLQAIAEEDGRAAAMRRALTRQRAVPTDADAVGCLPLLDGLLILVDDADHLAEVGNGFTKRFFDELRARIQARENGVQWVSVSRQPLAALFARAGWTSPFLNDAEQYVAGALDPAEAEAALAARYGAAMARRMLGLTGTIPRLVYELCESEYEAVEATLARLAGWGGGMFEGWWERPAREQAVLRAAVDGMDVGALSDGARAVAGRLCDRGLLVERGDAFALNGALWAGHVRRVV